MADDEEVTSLRLVSPLSCRVAHPMYPEELRSWPFSFFGVQVSAGVHEHLVEFRPKIGDRQMGPLLVVPACFLYPCQKGGPVLREKGTLCKLVLVPLEILPFFVHSVCKLMLKDTLNGATIPSPRGCCQLQSISVVVQCTASVNMNSSRKTRKVDLSISEWSKESRSH